MKSIWKMIGIIAFVLIIGLLVMACPDGNNSRHKHEASGNWVSDGTQHWKVCADDGTKVDAANHTFPDWTVDVEATEEVAGSESTECTICGCELTEIIPKLSPADAIVSNVFNGEAEEFVLKKAEEAEGFSVGSGTVNLSSFYISKYEVTQEQYTAVMGTNPSYFQGTARLPDAGETQEKRPVEQVSWYDAIVFCNKLSIAEGLTPAYYMNTTDNTNPDTWEEIPTSSSHDNYAAWNTGIQCNFKAGGYRLPTEAEWEYAARAGGVPYEYGNNTPETNAVAWYSGNSNSKTHEVGKKAANALGLYDMVGNVSEWCWDWYESTSKYPNDPEDPSENPTGASSGAYRVVRSGDWYNVATGLCSSSRYNGDPSVRYGRVVGFRLVRPVV